jgi:hypothetical protein
MNAVSQQDVPVVIEGDGVEVRVQEIGGGMSTAFVRLPQGTDLGPALKGLPDDRCQCPHWGYLLRPERSRSRVTAAWRTLRSPACRAGRHRGE